MILGLPLAEAAEAHVFETNEDRGAPDLIDAELLHVIRSHERRELITLERSAAARQALLDLPITRYTTLTLIGRAWELRHNFTAYDAMYVALAEALGAPLVTADERLATAARTHTAIDVVLLADAPADKE